MMGRVRSSRSMSGGMEVAHRGVARRLQPTLSTGPDVRVRSLKPIVVLPDMHKNTVVECALLRIKQNLYSTLQNMIFKLEQWQVKVESTGRKVKRLKSEDNFWYF